MSAFEFIFTANTIILALVIARLLESLRDSFDRRRRYWIHCLWVVNRIMVVFGSLLMAFAVRDRAGQDALDLLIIVTPAVVLFLQVNALVTSQPTTIESWKDHFWNVKKWFFGANVLYTLGIFVVASYGTIAGLTIFQRYAAPTVGIALSTIG
ncbi:MAG: hypothetical protein JRF61_16645 [Deltaproteobacteria bacterium]|nr:hypothetical protein [Deltaproteobacteria bacterium]